MSYIGNSSTTQTYVAAIDYFNGNGVTVAFTLSRPVATSAQVQVTIENVPQNPGTAFSIVGSTITFTSAPPAGSSNIYVYYTSPVTQVIAPSSGTVGTAQMANGVTVNFNDGSASAPSITNAGDTNTGMFFPAADTIAFSEGGVEAMRLDASGNVGIGTSSPTEKLAVAVSSAGNVASLRNNLVSGFSSLQLVDNTGTERAVFGYGNSSAPVFASNAYVFSASNFVVATGGTTERMRIDTSGNLLVNNTNASFTNSNSFILSAINGDLSIQHNNTRPGGSAYVWFTYNGSPIGSITQNGTTAVAYNTTSDYRLKDNIAPMTGALDKVALLKPVTYTWKADGSDGQGFIAHELAEVVPDAVTGEKDAVNEDGNPLYQGIDTSYLVATLTAAIQEQQAIINDLKARIETLEAK